MLVLEKDDVGFEQSGRSVAAINLPGGAPTGRPDSMFRVSADEWSTFERRWDCSVDLNDEGWHILVADDEDERWLEIDRAIWRETSGYAESELLEPDAARERFPQLDGSFLGLEVRHGGHVDAVLVMGGLRAAAARLGVEVRCDTLVTGFDVAGGSVTAVRTGDPSVPCGTLVVSAGIWSSQLCDTLVSTSRCSTCGRRRRRRGRSPPGRSPLSAGLHLGARQNRNGTVRITGGYRYSAMLHDLSFRDLRDLRLWAPLLWQNRKDVAFRLDPALLAASSGAAGPVDAQATTAPSFHRTTTRRLGRATAAGSFTTSGDSCRHSGRADSSSLCRRDGSHAHLEPVIGRIPGLENAYACTAFSGHGYIYGPGACRALAGLVIDGDPGVDLTPYRPERLEGKLSMRAQIF